MLDCAVGAHLEKDAEGVRHFLAAANNTPVRNYIESLWGSAKQWPDQVHYRRYREVSSLPEKKTTPEKRMPTAHQKKLLVQRDGFQCRYCRIPVIPAQVRKTLSDFYPELEIWGKTNATQHAGFQALWLQFDHIIPASYGGENELQNLVVCCAGCNFGKMEDHIEQLGLRNPLSTAVNRTGWDGLTRLFGGFEYWKP